MVYAGFTLKKWDSSSSSMRIFKSAFNEIKIKMTGHLEYAPLTSEVLGRGFLVWVLGLFHLEITAERAKGGI